MTIDYSKKKLTPAPVQESRFRFLNGRGRTIRNIVIVLLAAGILVWIIRPSAQQQPAGGRFGAGAPISVNTAVVEKGDVKVVLNALGTVTPLATVTVLTQISGQLQHIGFQEGQMVKAGDFLAQIDPRPYQAALEQAQGTLAKDQALLKDAKLDMERYRKLVAQDSIASQQYDTQAALVQQYQGQVLADQASVDSARVNLNYCHIVSPVTGRVGLRQVDEGNYITPSSTTNGIVVVTQLQPISVIFTLPEDNILSIAKPVHNGAILTVAALDRGNTSVLANGKLTNIDNQVDTTTGTFKLRAQFDNSDESLFPNQFVNIQLLVDTLHDQMIVPTASVQRGAPGTFVYVANSDSTVSVRPVKLGVTEGEKQSVISGLKPGEIVVTDGVDRLRDGAKVTLPGNAPPTEGAPTGRRNRKGPSGGNPDGAGPPAGQPGGQPGGRPPAQ